MRSASVGVMVVILIITSALALLSCNKRASEEPKDRVQKFLQEGFTLCSTGNIEAAEAKWSEAMSMLQAKPDTEKRQADNLVKMGNALKLRHRENEALNKFSHALALYRGIADVEGQKICITSIEEISPLAIAILGKHICTTPNPPERRIKFDKDGYMIGIKPTEEEDALFTAAAIEAPEKKQNRTEEEEKTLKSLKEKKRQGKNHK